MLDNHANALCMYQRGSESDRYTNSGGKESILRVDDGSASARWGARNGRDWNGGGRSSGAVSTFDSRLIIDRCSISRFGLPSRGPTPPRADGAVPSRPKAPNPEPTQPKSDPETDGPR